MGKNPRRPVRFALFNPGCVTSFDLRVRLRKDPKDGESDLLIAFGYQDRLHFYYAHLSERRHEPAGAQRPVQGGQRRPPAHRWPRCKARSISDTEWHDVRIERNAESGSNQAFHGWTIVAGFPSHRQIDCPRLVGFGSFNDTGVFDDIVLTGTPSDECKGPINTLDPPEVLFRP